MYDIHDTLWTTLYHIHEQHSCLLRNLCMTLDNTHSLTYMRHTVWHTWCDRNVSMTYIRQTLSHTQHTLPNCRALPICGAFCWSTETPPPERSFIFGWFPNQELKKLGFFFRGVSFPSGSSSGHHPKRKPPRGFLFFSFFDQHRALQMGNALLMSTMYSEYPVLQYIQLYVSALQHTATHCNTPEYPVLQYIQQCVSATLYIPVCCSVLQCVAVRCSVLHYMFRCVAVCCSALQCIAIYIPGTMYGSTVEHHVFAIPRAPRYSGEHSVFGIPSTYW